MSKQRSKEEIQKDFWDDTDSSILEEPIGSTYVLKKGIDCIIEVLCDIRDNQKEQTVTYIPNGMPPIERPK